MGSRRSLATRGFLFLAWSHWIGSIMAHKATSVLSQQHTQHQRRRLRNLTYGNVKVLVLLVRFTNHVNRDLPPRQHFVDLCQKDLSDYLFLQSYGQYNLTECQVMPWLTTDISETQFAAGRRGFFNALASSRFFTPILDSLNDGTTGANITLDWRDFDVNGDSELDALLVFHSGFPSEGGSGSSCNEPSRENRVRSQAYWSSPEGSWSNDLVRLNGYAIASAFDGVCDLSRFVQLGVPAHEFLHTFEALDLYDTRNGFIGGLGNWDIMANPYGPGADPAYPGSLSPWSRAKVGWQRLAQDDNDGLVTTDYTITEIITNGIYTLRASNRFPDAYQIRQNFPVGEYLLIENRQPVDYDQLMYGNGGILIYHVDDTQNLQANPGFPEQPGWPINGNHYQVALVQADGEYHLERTINDGDAGDLWTLGMILGPSTTEFPNTNSYQNGQVFSTGIEIEILTASAMTMQFRVSGLPDVSSMPSDEPSELPSANPTQTLSTMPSQPPSLRPSTVPSLVPTSSHPSLSPSLAPEAAPSLRPSSSPTVQPSAVNSDEPSLPPSTTASDVPTMNDPTASPSVNPTIMGDGADPAVSASTRHSGLLTAVASCSFWLALYLLEP